MTKHETDPTCGNGAVTTRMPLPSVVFSKIATAFDGIDTTRARTADPKGHRRCSPSGFGRCPSGSAIARLPEGARVLFTGCGTSFHAALACGRAAQALELVLGNAPEADVLVAIVARGRDSADAARRSRRSRARRG